MLFTDLAEFIEDMIVDKPLSSTFEDYPEEPHDSELVNEVRLRLLLSAPLMLYDKIYCDIFNEQIFWQMKSLLISPVMCDTHEAILEQEGREPTKEDLTNIMRECLLIGITFTKDIFLLLKINQDLKNEMWTKIISFEL